MVSIVWPVFVRCSSTHGAPRAQPFVKVGAPCPMESAPLGTAALGDAFRLWRDEEIYFAFTV